MPRRGRIWDRIAVAVIAPAALAAATLSGGAVALAGPVPLNAGPDVSVIVRYHPDGAVTAERAVESLGGHLGVRLGLVDAFAATVPAGALARLSTAASILEITPNGPLQLKAADWLAESDANTMYSVTRGAGAQEVWGRLDANGRRITGQGVGVALIDSGITPVKGLSNTAKVVNGPDLSFESQAANLRHLDTFGHGTHMAGIIAGRDPEMLPGQESNPLFFVGMAPDAKLVNVKVAAANGAVDVSQVIAAIDWVVTHRNDAGLNIRVINLSFGTDSVQDPRLDPLSYAVEAAWRKGIVVVAAAGNGGATDTRLSDPAINPYVIAVGGSDTAGTDARFDDKLAAFSTRGNTTRHADLIAPGKSIVSLRDPGSYIDSRYPGGLIPNDTAKRFFRGSGTSQSAAVVSGAAALLLQQRPWLTPDQVKRLLMTTATPVAGADSTGQGAGEMNVSMAINAATPVYMQTSLAALGTGTLEGARGTAHVTDPANGVVLTGEKDIMGKPWKPATWCPLSLSGAAWSGGTWNGSGWTGSAWTGSSWTATTWSATTWSGTTWSGTTWSSHGWSNATWTGTTWSGTTWSGTTWSGTTWSGGYWSSGTWD